MMLKQLKSRKAVDLFRSTALRLREGGVIEPYKEAEEIIHNVLGIPLYVIYRDDPYVGEKEESLIEEFLLRRLSGEPLQYILGYVEFLGLYISIGPGVLIPRPETEILAYEAITLIESRFRNIRVKILDLCTGSGCIALSISKRCQNTVVYAVDISHRAISYAKENKKRHGIEHLYLIEGDLFKPFCGSFDLIISNPPYIRSCDIEGLQREVKDWEPRGALDGGLDGLDFYRRIISDAGNYLKEKGVLMLELGYNQADDVSIMAKEYGFNNVRIIKDYSGIRRILYTERG